MSRRLLTASLLVASLALAGILAAPASSQLPTSSHNCSKKRHKSTGRFRARLHAPGHRPSNWQYIFNRDEQKQAWTAVWPISITVTRNGHRIAGHVSYQFIFSGQIVACRTVLAPYKPNFRHGLFRDRIEWPEQSVGYPLTFRAVVSTRWGTRNLDYRVVVQPRS